MIPAKCLKFDHCSTTSTVAGGTITATATTELLGESAELLGELVELLGELVELLGELAELLGELVELPGELAELLGELGELLGESADSLNPRWAPLTLYPKHAEQDGRLKIRGLTQSSDGYRRRTGAIKKQS